MAHDHSKDLVFSSCWVEGSREIIQLVAGDVPFQTDHPCTSSIRRGGNADATVNTHLRQRGFRLCKLDFCSQDTRAFNSPGWFSRCPRGAHTRRVSLPLCDPVPSRWGRSGDWLPSRGREGRPLLSARLTLHCASISVQGTRPHATGDPDAHTTSPSTRVSPVNTLSELGHGLEEEAADVLCEVRATAQPGRTPMADLGGASRAGTP